MQIHRVPTPSAPDAEPHPLVHAMAEVGRASLAAEYGHEDFTESARFLTVRLADCPERTTAAWVALPDGVDPDACAPTDGLGWATLAVFLTEDHHLAHVHITTHPDHRGRGHGRALWDAVQPDLHASGRTTWFCGVYAPGAEATGPDAVVAKSGSGALDGTTPVNRWLQREGFELEQCERPSTLALGEGVLARAASLEREAGAVAGEAYELVHWADEAPEHLVAGLAALNARMSTDAPVAGLEFEEQVWDADRLRRAEERTRLAGHRSVTTAAIDRTSGQVAAFTALEWPETNGAGIWQENTIVLPEHRGHRLGLWVKAANVRHLMASNPDALRIHTWNADENQWMLAINDALGFTPIGLEGIWQKRL